MARMMADGAHGPSFDRFDRCTACGEHIADPHAPACPGADGSAPVEVYSPSGRCIGWTDDPWAAAQFQRAGYIAV